MLPLPSFIPIQPGGGGGGGGGEQKGWNEGSDKVSALASNIHNLSNIKANTTELCNFFKLYLATISYNTVGPPLSGHFPKSRITILSVKCCIRYLYSTANLY